MNTLRIASASVAALVAVAMFDARPAEARKGFSGGRSFSAPRASMGSRPMMRSAKPLSLGSKPKLTARHLSGPKTKLSHKHVGKLKQAGSTKLKHVGKIDKGVLGKGASTKLGKAHLFKPAKLNLATLPKHKGMVGKAGLVGRIGVPKHIKPKLALAMGPKPHLKHAFAPFVQRHWKKSFFWVAVAGIGYVTVPHLYYDRFYTCTHTAYPDYDECARILSYAAVEEEEVSRVRYPMPSAATYRYTAKAQPTREARQACSFEPFVERKWNREFVWVQIPDTGNVTVPEDIYDTFQGKVDGEPPDYTAACKVLVEAAAADSVVATTTPDLGRNL
jgi:hypothetical protein